MKSIAKTLVLWLTAGLCSQSLFANESPNVLFIAVDDLRDWVGHLDGHPQAKTPNIDRHGLTFDTLSVPRIDENKQ